MSTLAVMREHASVAEPPAGLDGFEPWVRTKLASRGMPAHLLEAVEYALLGPGKRVRPALCVASAQACGGRPEQAWPAAAAVEMIHAFSLVHDDLPAMDDDDTRRGRPTLHKHAGEAMAILAGDALVALAFEWLAGSPDDSAGSVEASALIASLAAATTDMVCGQVDDTLPNLAEGVDEASKLLRVHERKTGALLKASCTMGAISVGADADQLAAISAYGVAVGLMFQIVDDLLDVTVSSEQAGKRTGKDAQRGKLTYPGVWGIEPSRAKVRELHAAAREAIRPLGAPADRLAQWCDWLAEREK